MRWNSVNIPFKRNKKEEEKQLTVERPEKAAVAISNFIDYEKELEPTQQTHVISNGQGEYRMQLVSAGNVFSGYSLEDALKKGFGSNTKYFNWYKSTGVARKCIN